MFMNPPETGVTLEESLLMGGRHTAVRSSAGTTYTTWITVQRFDPVYYEVQHVVQGKHAARWMRSFQDLDEALRWFVLTHDTDWKDAS